MDSRPYLLLQKSRLTYLLPWMVLVIFLAVTYMLWKNEQQIVFKELQAEFNFRVRDAKYRINDRIKIYEQVLHGAEGFFNHAHKVERKEFHNYVDMLHLPENYPGVQGLGFAQMVSKAEKSRHIAAIRKQGVPDYTLTPEGERDFYTPIIYVEQYNESAQSAIGYDMSSDREHPLSGDFTVGMRRTAMENARDFDHAVISDMTWLSQVDVSDTQILMFAPVYKYGMPHNTLAERRANINGWVYASLRMIDLMADMLGEHAAEVDIEIYNGDEVVGDHMMYDSDNIPRTHLTTNDARFQATTHFDFVGQHWTMVVHSLPSFERLQDDEKPRLVAIGGIGISILLALLTWLYLFDRERTHNLLRQNRYLSMRMFAILEEDRRNLALELHDEIGQWLTAIQFQAKNISKIAVNHPAIHDSIRIINESASEMHEVLRKIVHNLRPSRLDALGLVESLNKLVSEWCEQQSGRVKYEFVTEGELGDLGDNLNITLYRIVQESLNNAAKHAYANRISVKLQRLPGKHPGSNTVVLSVKDDGVGFDPGQPTEGVGLLGMRERVIAADGKFDLYSEPGHGVRIACELPVQPSEKKWERRSHARG